MKKFVTLLLFVFLLSSNVFAREIPKKIDGMTKNDFLLNRVMLPNPNIYLYGTDSNGFPILLMNFSSTIPFYGIEDNYKIFPWLGRYIPFFLKKTSSLKFYSLYLTIEPSCDSPEGKNFYYKILKLQCREVSQTIGHEDTDKLTTKFEPDYKGQKAGFIQSENERKRYYASQYPIITYSGTGSNMLQIMLKRGKKFPIPAGHIDVSMVVMAIPSYNPPLTYDTLKGNCGCKYDFVKDFIDYIDADCYCNHGVKRVNFAKTYLDSRIKNYYGLDPKNNPDICLGSEVIMGSRINQVVTKTFNTKTITNITTPICPPNKCIDSNTGCCKSICTKQKKPSAEDSNKTIKTSAKTLKTVNSKKCPKTRVYCKSSKCESQKTINLQYEQKDGYTYLNQESVTITEDENLDGTVLKDEDFMYNAIITGAQKLNSDEPVVIKFTDSK